jgi:hypothetical protein
VKTAERDKSRRAIQEHCFIVRPFDRFDGGSCGQGNRWKKDKTVHASSFSVAGQARPGLNQDFVNPDAGIASGQQNTVPFHQCVGSAHRWVRGK